MDGVQLVALIDAVVHALFGIMLSTRSTFYDDVFRVNVRRKSKTVCMASIYVRVCIGAVISRRGRVLPSIRSLLRRSTCLLFFVLFFSSCVLFYSVFVFREFAVACDISVLTFVDDDRSSVLPLLS